MMTSLDPGDTLIPKRHFRFFFSPIFGAGVILSPFWVRGGGGSRPGLY